MLDIYKDIPAPYLGTIWESFIYAELRKLQKTNDSFGKLFFYRDQQGTEVDFLRSQDHNIDLMECKWTEVASLSDCKKLLTVGELITQSQQWTLRKTMLVCRSHSHYPLSPTLDAINGFELTRILSQI